MNKEIRLCNSLLRSYQVNSKNLKFNSKFFYDFIYLRFEKALSNLTDNTIHNR